MLSKWCFPTQIEGMEGCGLAFSELVPHSHIMK